MILLAAVLAARLTARQREAFIDAAIIGRPLADIAHDMGVSTQAVSQRVTTARVKLARTRIAQDLRNAA